MLAGFKEKLNAPPQPQQNASTTPEGSPGPGYVNPLNANHQQPPSGGAASATSAQAADTSSILKALADMAKKNTAPPAAAPNPRPAAAAVPSPSVPAATTAASTANPLASFLGQAVSGPPPQIHQSSVTPVGAPNPLTNAASAPGTTAFGAGGLPRGLSGLNLAGGTNTQAPPAPTATQAANPLAALLGQAQQPAAPPTNVTPTPVSPAVPGAAPGLGGDAMQQLNLLPLLMAQGIPQEQWAPALQALSLLTSAQTSGLGLNPAALTAALTAFGGAQAPQGGAPGTAPLPTGPGAGGWPAQPGASHDPRDRHDRHYDRDRDFNHTRSPPYRRRSRSPWDRRRELSPPRRRESPVYGEYRNDSPGRRGAGGMRG
ncbi:hypothetical protein KEM54_002863, partial [Ascosphaera aggregata]